MTPLTVPATPPTTLPTGLLGCREADGPAGLTTAVGTANFWVSVWAGSTMTTPMRQGRNSIGDEY